jgi:hypothetical protein
VSEFVFVAYGGGTNSTAMLIEMVKRGERVDVSCFADTGGERPETYTFVQTFSDWLVANGYPPITIVRAPTTTLEADCLRRKALPSVAYGWKTCSQRFKTQPQDKYLNSLDAAKAIWAAGGKVTKLIGYDADEPQRAKPYSDDKFTVRYPLIEWDMGRDECIETIRAEGLPLPGKSACFFCPNSTPEEVLELDRTHPALLQRALHIEENADLQTIAGLGRRWSWSDLIRQGRAQIPIFPEQEMPCGCYDGSPA